MEKVIGYPYYKIEVRCPDCGDVFDVIEQDEESEITRAMFTNTDESCTNIDIGIVCPHCDKEMILDKLEY